MNQEIVLNRLIEMLSDGNKSVVAETIKTLNRFGEKAIPCLIRALGSEKRAVRNGVLTILEKVEAKDLDFFNIIKKEIHTAYMNLLDIDVLEKSEQNDYIKLLIRHLRETNEETVQTIFKILKILDKEGKLRIIEKSLKASDKNQLAIAIETLESFMNPKLIGDLIPLLDDVPKHVRIDIARKRLNLKSDDLHHMLMRLLKKDSRTTRLCTVYIIGNVLKDKRYIDIIKELQDSKDNILKETATLTLKKIQGEDEKKGGPQMLSTMDKILSLKKVPIFSDLKVRELAAISSITEEKMIKGNQVIFKEGAEGDSMYIILSGEVSIIKNYDKPDATILTNLKEGDYFGEMALFEAAPRSATVKTNADTDLLMIGKLEFEEIMQEYPSISINICKVLSHRLRTSDIKIVDSLKDVHRRGESREHPRFKVDLKTKIDDKTSSIDGILDNISVGGAFVKSEKILPPGTSITMMIDTGEERGKLTLEGKIIRSISSDLTGMSIKFREASPEIKGFIERFIAKEDEEVEE